VKNKYVVAWYCGDAAEPTNPEKSKKNVGKICNTQGYNECYNKMTVDSQNLKRKHHETPVLEFDANAARAIQHEMNRASFKGIMPLVKDRAEDFKDCGELIYFQNDPAKKHDLST